MITKTDKVLLASSIICFLLITTRILYTGQLTYVFLIWNLFLAGIPYLISKIIEINKTNIKKWQVLLGIFFWLPIFPNSPYILTDFVHLTYNKSNLFWADVTLIAIFSLTGLMFGVYSIISIRQVVKKKFNSRVGHLFFYGSIFLAGFGIYIGRVLRWNSWDIISNPNSVLVDLLDIMFSPVHNYQIWVVSLGFSLMILMATFLLKPHVNLLSKN